MTRHALDLAPGLAAQAVDALNTLDGLPAPGVNVGRGRHVAIQPTWDGAGPVPIGWSRHESSQHPTQPALRRVSVTMYTYDRIQQAAFRARCTAPQLAIIDSLTFAPGLPPEWTPAGLRTIAARPESTRTR